MPHYNYRAGKKRILDILNDATPIAQVEKIPKDKTTIPNSAYISFISAVFIDIRNSDEIFHNKDSIEVAKILRSFTSEVIQILTENDNEDLVREVGVRDDCTVYTIFSTPGKTDIQSVLERLICINTYVDMLNKLLTEHEIEKQLRVGIGMATSQELIIDAGIEGSKGNNTLWIGKAKKNAARFAGVGGKDGILPIAISDMTYLNLSDQQQQAFAFIHSKEEGYLYHSNSIHRNMYKWIKDGMS